MKNNYIDLIRTNWKAGVTVGLVSIPLAVSLAVATQTAPVVGIITAIWAGLIASIFGGSNYNIIGPTGALAGVLIVYTSKYGSSCLPMIALVAGIFIFIAYIFKFEKYLIFVPGSALHGFILGVSVIVILTQVEAIFGLPPLPKHETLLANVYESLCNLKLMHLPSFVLFGCMYACLIAFSLFLPRIPGAIVVTPIGILIGYFCSHGILPWTLPTLGTKYHSLSASLFQLPSLHFNFAYLLPALSVAAISILETMISARIADGATKTKHNRRKEMLGLSLANIASGFAGGLPATAALARTSLNIRSGGTHKMAAGISSLFIALASLCFLQTFQYLPLAVIAAILVYIATGMLETEHFWYMYRIDKKNIAISLIVAFFTVYEDAIIGILLGAVIAMLLMMQRLSTGYHEIIIKGREEETPADQKQQSSNGNTLVYAIKGQLAYINAQSHLAQLENISAGYTNIVLKLRDVYFIDLDGVDAFGEITQMLLDKGKNVFVVSPNPVIEHLLRESNQFLELQKNNHVYPDLNDALKGIQHTQQ
ncbi:MAG: SulP family inorganic anion transporter [Candidatus Babeliales bacterium]|jgi:SulP family sulfate permease